MNLGAILADLRGRRAFSVLRCEKWSIAEARASAALELEPQNRCLGRTPLYPLCRRLLSLLAHRIALNGSVPPPGRRCTGAG